MRHLTCAAALLAIIAVPLAAQKKPDAAPKQAGKPMAVKAPAAAVGTWQGRSMLGPKDSVATTFTLTINADGTGTQLLPNRPPVAMKVVAAGGDSIVAESAKFKSVLRPNVTVAIRTTFHIKGNTMSGPTHADYSDGTAAELKTTATRKK